MLATEIKISKTVILFELWYDKQQLYLFFGSRGVEMVSTEIF
jgi:hypothetical protein